MRSIFAPRRRLLGSFWRLAMGLVLVAAIVWLAGLFWYAGQLPEQPSPSTQQTDAIVVLTGGSGRLEKGLELLADNKAEKLFVSGVYRGLEVRELLRLFQESPGELDCCVALGYEADNTRGNAVETAAWMSEEGYESLRLVTANYHMPRSLLEFEESMPRSQIIPHPVFPAHYKQEDWWRWPGSARLLVSEYNKYLLALVRQTITAQLGRNEVPQEAGS
ncbi:MAG: YdcF family protein [Pseudomonadota bacterium]